MIPLLQKLVVALTAMLAALSLQHVTAPQILEGGPGLPKTIEYEVWYTDQDDSGAFDRVAVNFYEDDIQSVVTPATPTVVTATTTIQGTPTTTKQVYVPTKRLTKADMPQFSSMSPTIDATGGQAIVFTPKDFGTIKSLDGLETFLKTQLAKDTTRTPLPMEAVDAAVANSI